MRKPCVGAEHSLRYSSGSRREENVCSVVGREWRQGTLGLTDPRACGSEETTGIRLDVEVNGRLPSRAQGRHGIADRNTSRGTCRLDHHATAGRRQVRIERQDHAARGEYGQQACDQPEASLSSDSHHISRRDARTNQGIGQSTDSLVKLPVGPVFSPLMDREPIVARVGVPPDEDRDWRVMRNWDRLGGIGQERRRAVGPGSVRRFIMAIHRLPRGASECDVRRLHYARCDPAFHMHARLTDEDGMVERLGRVLKARADVLPLRIRIVSRNLIL